MLRLESVELAYTKNKLVPLRVQANTVILTRIKTRFKLKTKLRRNPAKEVSPLEIYFN
jgi:hypothetical protein